MVVMYESSFIQVMVVWVREISVAGFAHKKGLMLSYCNFLVGSSRCLYRICLGLNILYLTSHKLEFSGAQIGASYTLLNFSQA